MESAYQSLAIVLSDQCPPAFEMAWINADLAEGYSHVQYWYDINGEVAQPIVMPMQKSAVDDALHDLRESMTMPGQEPWSRCTFTLFPDGKFKFDVEYDD